MSSEQRLRRTRRLVRAPLVAHLMLAIPLAGCLDDIAVREECQPGDVEGCFCDGLIAGTRTCLEDTSWSPCDCEGPADDVDVAFDTPPADSAADAPTEDDGSASDVPHEADVPAEDVDAQLDPDTIDLDMRPDEPVPCADDDDCGESSYCGPDEMCHDGSPGDPCSESAQCGTGAPVCDALDRECRPRREGDPCGTGCPSSLFCVDGTCFDGSAGDPCNDSDDCDDAPYCEESADVCVECLDASHCDAEETEPICDAADHMCRRCTDPADDAACALHSATACVTSGPFVGQCGECDPARFGTVCSGQMPICDLDSATCRPCSEDSDDCDPEGTTGLVCVRDGSDVDGTCQTCVPDGDFGCDGDQRCHPESYSCVECLTEADCIDDDVCTNNSCGSCTSDADCLDNPSGEQCVAGGCRQCDPIDDAGCGGETPVCESSSLTCVQCDQDGDCGACQTCGIGNICSPQTAANGNGCNDECSLCASGMCVTRDADDNVECAPCRACGADGGSCSPQSGADGNDCNTDCTFCDSGVCEVRSVGSTTECGACQECGGAAGGCQPQANGNDGYLCELECTRCLAGNCVDRNVSDSTECSTCHTCGPSGGDCLAQHGSGGNNCNSPCSHCDFGICRTRSDGDDTECGTCSECSSGVCTGITGESGKFCDSSSTYCCQGACVDPVGMGSEYNSGCGTGDCAGGLWGCAGTSPRCSSFDDPCDYCNTDGRPVDADCTADDGASCSTGTIIEFCQFNCDACVDLGPTASCQFLPCGIDDCPQVGDVCDGEGVCRTGEGGACSVAINCASRMCSQQICAACPF